MKYIITTSIYEPTEATLKFSQMSDWQLVVVGDLKTPHDSYKNINCIYLSPNTQEELYPEVSKAVGWNCIMRRNIGFLFAYENNAELVASVDDDNIPYENWGKEIFVGKEIELDAYLCNNSIVFDPLSLTNHPYLWHRGYPLEAIPNKQSHYYIGKRKYKPLIQADLWDGDPDIDAICRLIHNPQGLNLKIDSPFYSPQFTPFNSQNTFLAREVLPYYMVLPHVGRVDDIWGGYIAQYLLNTRPMFYYSTVYQDRNKQNIYKNLQDEVFGYTTTYKLLIDIQNYLNYLPEKAGLAFEVYRREYARIDSNR